MRPKVLSASKLEAGNLTGCIVVEPLFRYLADRFYDHVIIPIICREEWNEQRSRGIKIHGLTPKGVKTRDWGKHTCFA